jgi:HAD superfamily hydrolase (TIGR01549 family)
MHIDEYDVIILDCDGVIFNSNSLKIDAFRRVLSQYGTMEIEGFINYFKSNFGTSRYSLVKVFIESFLKEEYDDIKYKDILRRYGEECVGLYKDAKFTSYLIDFLNKYNNQCLYVASGSDGLELRSVFIQRNIAKYFKSIYGSPIKKTEIVRNICKQNFNKRILMIGDAKSDMLASKDNDIDFIFMKDFSTSQEMKENTRLMTIDNLGCLL